MLKIDRRYKRVTVFGQDVKIRYLKKLPDNDKGNFLADEKEIRISKAYDDWKETLLHEICHAIMAYSGHGEKFSIEEEEALVRAIEHGLTTLVFS